MIKKIQSIPYPTYTTAERDLLVGVLKNTKINTKITIPAIIKYFFIRYVLSLHNEFLQYVHARRLTT